MKLNPLIPLSDQHVIPPYSNTAESLITIMRMTYYLIANLTKVLIVKQILLYSFSKELNKEVFREYGYITDVRVERVKE